jgi:hypothetical protein
MRKIDKIKNIKKVNMLLENRKLSEDFDYPSEENAYHDRQDFDKENKLQELGDKLSFVISNLRGKWNVTKKGDSFVVTNDNISDKEMIIGLSNKNDEYIYTYELNGVNRNPKTGLGVSGHQGNYTIQKSRINSNIESLFEPGTNSYELWFR